MKKHLFITLISCLFCVVSYSQRYGFINYSIEEGLAQSQVRSLLQDSKGYLWIGTLGGVSRFDGVVFMNLSKQDGLLDNQVNVIYEGENGERYFGTGGGISVFKSGKIKSFALPAEFDAQHVLDIIQFKNKIFIATDGAGFFEFDGHNFLKQVVEDGLPNSHIRKMIIWNDNLYMATRKGIAKMEMNTNTQTLSSVETLLPNESISDMFIDHQNQLWVSTYGSGVFCYNQNESLHIGTAQGLVSDFIRNIIVDGNKLWATSKVGVSRVEFVESIPQITNFSFEEGLPMNNIRNALIDDQGNLWFGSDGSGIIKLANECMFGLTKADGMVNDLIMSVIMDYEGIYWFSTYGDGIIKYDGSTFENFNSMDGLSNNTVWCSLMDKDGVLWFGTSNGLNSYLDGKFKYYLMNDGLAARKITCMALDDENRIWLGTKDGITSFSNGEFKNYDQSMGFSGINVNDIIIKNGVIWIAAINGLFSFDGEKFKQWGTKDGLSDIGCKSLCADENDGIWVGTANGINHYSNGKFKRVDFSEDFGAGSINFTEIDHYNNLWIGTDNGVFSMDIVKYYNHNEVEIEQYNRQNGLLSLETNQNACFVDMIGKVWMGTGGGLAIYDAEKKRSESNKTIKTHLQDIQLFLEPLEKRVNGIKYNEQTGLPDDLLLNHDQNYLTFHFIGIHYSNPLKIKYRFKLEGLDEEWLPITKSRVATYSNLSPGNYTFHVTACPECENFEKVSVSFDFAIKPAYYQTWWFMSLCSMLSLAILFYIYNRRRELRKSRAEKQRAEYKSKLLALEQQTLNVSMNRHFIFNALNSIQYYINTNDKLAANKYLSDFARLVRKNLDSSQVNTVALSEEIERLKLYLSLESMRFPDKFEYHIQMDENLPADDLMIPSMLLQPFVENSIQHGILPMEKNGVVNINITQNDESLKIEITDNGIGIEASLKLKNKTDDRVSLGMKITEERFRVLRELTNKQVEIIGPKEIKDEHNITQGTNVIIVIPIELV